MKTSCYIAFLAIVLSTVSYAQNKTLGVGTATPNINAALHVESPTLNQGFIMPRLSTAQRTGIPALTATEEGMMVYDRDIKKFFVWDGTAWQAATGLTLPFSVVMANASTLFNVANTGTGTAGIFQITNAANSVPALGAATVGTGPALQVDVINASNTAAALNINHGGTGNAITANRPIQASAFIGDGSALTNLPGFALPFTGTSGTAATTFNIGNTGTGVVAIFANSNTSSNSVVAVSNSGTGDAMAINTTNASNSFPALNITHSGLGSAIRTNRLIESAVGFASGQAGAFAITNASNPSSALVVDTNGSGYALDASNSSPLGPAVNVAISNAGNASSSLTARTNGTGAAIESINTGTGRGLELTLSNAGNTQPGININHAGSGPALASNKVISVFNPSTTGFSGDFRNTNAGNTQQVVNIANAGSGVGLWSETTGPMGTSIKAHNSHPSSGVPTFTAQNDGDASAGTFTIIKATNNLPSLSAITSGTGNAGNFSISNASNATSALHAETNGTGSALSINVSNASTPTPAMTITYAGTGNAITANAPIEATGFVGDGSQLTGVVVPDINITAAGQSVSIGKSVGTSNESVIIGDQAGNGVTGTANTFIGKAAGLSSTTGTTNVFLGWNAGRDNTVGSSNVIIGAGAGTGQVGVSHATGGNNVLIGTHADVGTDGLTNATAIGFEAVVNASNSIVLGNDAAKVGIGITNPTVKLEVVNAAASGDASFFRITDPSNTNTTLNVYNEGTGYAGYFRNGNALSTGNAVLAENYGTGRTLRAFAYGSGDALEASVIATATGRAGVFSIANASNSSAVLDISTNGTGLGMTLAHTGTAGTAGSFEIQNGSNNQPAFHVQTGGGGRAGEFIINSGGNGNQALYAETNGTGPALEVNKANSPNYGIAINIANGTIKHSVATIGSAGGSIAIRAGVYNISNGGTFTLPSGVVAGEICLVYNSFGGPITVEGTSVAAGTVRQFLFIGGIWRIVQ